MINLIQFTENDKRLIIVLLLIVILLFVIIGYISLFVKKIMDFQAKRADDMLHDVYKTGVVKTERQLRVYGIRKNWRYFFKQASGPMIILAVAWLLFLTYGILAKDGDFSKIDLWGYGTILNEGETAVGGEGIRTLFYIHDWANTPKIDFWGIKIHQNWPPLLNVPHWSWDAWFSYIFIPANLVGGVWLLVCVQAYIARTFRIVKLSLTLFKKTLDK